MYIRAGVHVTAESRMCERLGIIRDRRRRRAERSALQAATIEGRDASRGNAKTYKNTLVHSVKYKRKTQKTKNQKKKMEECEESVRRSGSAELLARACRCIINKRKSRRS